MTSNTARGPANSPNPRQSKRATLACKRTERHRARDADDGSLQPAVPANTSAVARSEALLNADHDQQSSAGEHRGGWRTATEHSEQRRGRWLKDCVLAPPRRRI